LFPLGVLQLYHSVSIGYFDARSFKFLSNRINALLEWLRLPADTLFILGTLPVLYLSWLGVSPMKPRTGFEEPRGELFTEIVETKRLKA
jgi:nitric oxide reductase subunit B